MAIPVYISASTAREIHNMSDACYISKEVLETLKVKTSEVEKGITIHTINGPMTEDIE